MTGEPEQGGGHRKGFNVTAWIGGLAAVVIVLAGLNAAGKLDVFGSKKSDETEQPSSTQAGSAPERQANVQAPAQAKLPTKYTGTWNGKDVTLEWRNGIWVEVTGGGSEDESVAHYEQLARTELMTNTIDRNKNLYVRWPSTGGTVERGKDGITWTKSYDVDPA